MVEERGRLFGEVAELIERRAAPEGAAEVEVAEVAGRELDDEEVDPGPGDGKEENDPEPEGFGAAAVAVHQHPDHEGGLEQRQDGVKPEDFEEIVHDRAAPGPGDAGNADLPIGGVRFANREIGVPGRDSV